MSASTKILVEWTQGRPKGTTSWLKRANVKDGLITVGQKVKVVWGKSKKLHDVIVKDDGTVPPSVQAPTSVTKRNQAKIELDFGSPVSSVEVEDNEILSLLPLSRCVPDAPSQTLKLPRDDVSVLIEKLHDFVSGQNAKIFARLDFLEKGMNARLDYLKKKLSERPETISRITGPPPFEPALLTPEPSQTPFSSPCFVSSPLQELNYCSNVQEYSVPDDILYTSLSACKSRRNLASRLATKIFTIEERVRSNSRGMRNAIDEACCKLKPIPESENCSYV